MSAKLGSGFLRLGGVLVAALPVVYGSLAMAGEEKFLTANPKQAAHFESKVRPVFVDKCIACHGEKQQQGGIRLDKPISSSLAKRVAEAVEYKGIIKMPPSAKLPADELAALSAWGRAGGPWSAKAAVATKKQFWSFVPPKMPALPKVKNTAWAKSPMDLFVLAKLEEKGLKPAPSADKQTLIRRATFDLTGLPPTPAEIDAFIADKSPKAFEKVIDRLLASDAYGERWGRHWLDVARYADSNGLDENLVFRNAWRYRDYVIDAINKDVPIDRFFQEQIAGDLLPNAGDDQIVATGYLALGGKMLAEDDPQKQELDIIDEQVDTLSKGMLGLTIGCARCHDHKYDPISAKDYYSMAGIFKSTKTMDKFTVVAEWHERPIGPKEPQERLKRIQADIRARATARDLIRKEERTGLQSELEPKKEAYVVAAKKQLEAEKELAALKPTLSARDGALPTGSLLFEAEDFVGGNVSKDGGGYGSGIGIIQNGGTYPNVVEYSVTVSQAGPYQLDLRYASGENRSVRVLVNGRLALSAAARENTGGFYPQHQKWVAEGIIPLTAGVNRIKLERESYFPHIDRVALVPKPGMKLTLASSDSGLIPEVVSIIADQLRNGAQPKIELPENADRLFPREKSMEIEKLDREIKELEASRPVIPYAMAVSDAPAKTLKVHLRGSYLTLGEDTKRGAPEALTASLPLQVPADKGGRLELAKWITSAKNPLTSRVFVNRVWRWRFGRGIVGTVDNFGVLGDLPTNPALLDWLALTFISQDKWSLKSLHKRMMLSSTYQMSTKYDARAASLDPDNQLLWRFNRKRLEAEAIRDSIFFVSGQLDRTKGGSMLNLPDRAYVTTTESGQTVNYDAPRRAVYLPVVRAAVYDVYTAFDFGDPTVMNGDRPSTTVAPQALFMLNAPIVLSATKAKAETLLKDTKKSDLDRIVTIFRTCYGRKPTASEISRSREYLKKFKAAYERANSKTPELNAWQSLCKSVIASNEFIYVE
jgi:mono/diheme cytochrome c family protein